MVIAMNPARSLACGMLGRSGCGLALACLLALAAIALPPAMAADTYFIFGYGSLLNTASTVKSNCGLSGFGEGDLDGLTTLLTKAVAATNGSGSSANAILDTIKACQVQGQRVVRIRGLERGWYFPSLGSIPVNPFGNPNAFNPSQLALGAVKKAGANVTGLIYEVDAAAYANTLVREVGYDIVELPSDSPDITILGGPPLPSGAKVAYFGSKPSSVQLPSAQLPIAYSYIDIFLGGAVDLQKQFNLTGPAYLAGSGGRYSSFLEETIKTTAAWSPYIVNDRTYPNRPFVMTRNAAAIDAALWAYLPQSVLKGVRYPGVLKSMKPARKLLMSY